jgi:hypothetical protein
MKPTSTATFAPSQTHVRRRAALAGAALGTLLAAGGAVGLAGAATGSTAPGSTTPNACVKAPQVEQRIQTRLGKVTTRLSKVEAREAKAVSSGHPKYAAKVERHINAFKSFEARAQARLAKIEAKCASGGTTVPSATATT